MSKPRMPLGNDIFEMLRNDGSYYIDKTMLISELVGNKENKVTLFTRPRRFGKTLNMSMLDCFFDITKDSKKLFDGLKIMDDSELCAEYMNQYPTIFISLKEVTGNNFEQAFNLFKVILSMWCRNHRYILTDTTDINSINLFNRLLDKTASLDDVQSSLSVMSELMYAFYNKPVIILIDEYDVPISYANENGYYKEMINVIRSMFSMALKTNPYLKFAVITGCLRIAKESIFTGTNNFVSYSIADREFGSYFGFTESEVAKLLADCELTDKADKIKEWYDGYLFGDTEIYCPWDVLNYVSALMKYNDAEPKNYWRNTSHNSIIRSFVDRTEFAVNDKFETLLNGGTIEQVISDDLTYDELYSTEENLWSMLYMTGYLTKADASKQGNELTLRIPNKEVLGIFEDTVVKWFNDNIEKAKQTELMQALWNGDEAKATELLSGFLWETISYNDYHEDYYHAFLAGIFTGLGYAVDSNKEYGLGRPDILLKDRNNRRALIIEAKRSPDKDSMPSICNNALEQIQAKEYALGIPDGYETILCYGIAFWQKRCMVKSS